SPIPEPAPVTSATLSLKPFIIGPSSMRQQHGYAKVRKHPPGGTAQYELAQAGMAERTHHKNASSDRCRPVLQRTFDRAVLAPYSDGFGLQAPLRQAGCQPTARVLLLQRLLVQHRHDRNLPCPPEKILGIG